MKDSGIEVCMSTCIGMGGLGIKISPACERKESERQKRSSVRMLLNCLLINTTVLLALACSEPVRGTVLWKFNCMHANLRCCDSYQLVHAGPRGAA